LISVEDFAFRGRAGSLLVAALLWEEKRMRLAQRRQAYGEQAGKALFAFWAYLTYDLEPLAAAAGQVSPASLFPQESSSSTTINRWIRFKSTIIFLIKIKHSNL
jgi:hypothetical protein